MCNPLAIGLALTAAGSVAQYRAQQGRDEAMGNAQRRELDRQDKLFKESQALFQRNRETYERPAADAIMESAKADRIQQYEAADRNAPRANEAPPGQGMGANQVVAEAFQRAAGDAAGQARQIGDAKATLASFGDFITGAAFENNRRSGDIGMLGSFKQGSSNVLPLELQGILSKPSRTATAGNLLTALGSAAMGSAGGGPGGNFLFGNQAAQSVPMSTWQPFGKSSLPGIL